jgi:ATP-dependent Lon protease
MFITTANTLPTIPVPLQDRMEIIRIPGYTELEKIKIAQIYLFRKQREANGITEKNIIFTESAIKMIIRRYSKESGVRNLEREIASICRKGLPGRKSEASCLPRKFQCYPARVR